MNRTSMVTHAAREAAAGALKSWMLDHLTRREPRFLDAWAVTESIPGWFYEPTAAAMFIALAETSPHRIVEIGSYLGRSTVFFAKAMDVLGLDGEVVAIDPHTGDRQHKEKLGVEGDLSSFALFRDHLAAAGVTDRVRPIVATSDETAVDWSDPIDFLFIDGWHSYDAVFNDGRAWAPFVTPTGVIVFDDTGNYPEVANAVSQLAKDNVVSFWGDVISQTWCGPPMVSKPSYFEFIYRTARLPTKARSSSHR